MTICSREVWARLAVTEEKKRQPAAARAERGAVTGKEPRGHGYLGGLIIAGIGRAGTRFVPGPSARVQPNRLNTLLTREIPETK